MSCGFLLHMVGQLHPCRSIPNVYGGHKKYFSTKTSTLLVCCWLANLLTSLWHNKNFCYLFWSWPHKSLTMYHHLCSIVLRVHKCKGKLEVIWAVTIERNQGEVNSYTGMPHIQAVNSIATSEVGILVEPFLNYGTTQVQYRTRMRNQKKNLVKSRHSTRFNC